MRECPGCQNPAVPRAWNEIDWDEDRTEFTELITGDRNGA